MNFLNYFLTSKATWLKVWFSLVCYSVMILGAYRNGCLWFAALVIAIMSRLILIEAFDKYVEENKRLKKEYDNSKEEDKSING